jgi:hypothetical protein
MRIDPRAPIAPPGAARPQAAGARFSLSTPAKADAAHGPAGTASLIGLDAVLALQGEENEPRERRRRAAKRGHRILDALESLKLALLSGRLPPGEVARLSREIADAGASSGDPRLDDILAHIELRARVELAKLAAR